MVQCHVSDRPGDVSARSLLLFLTHYFCLLLTASLSYLNQDQLLLKLLLRVSLSCQTVLTDKFYCSECYAHYFRRKFYLQNHATFIFCVFLLSKATCSLLITASLSYLILDQPLLLSVSDVPGRPDKRFPLTGTVQCNISDRPSAVSDQP